MKEKNFSNAQLVEFRDLYLVIFFLKIRSVLIRSTMRWSNIEWLKFFFSPGPVSLTSSFSRMTLLIRRYMKFPRLFPHPRLHRCQTRTRRKTDGVVGCDRRRRPNISPSRHRHINQSYHCRALSASDRFRSNRFYTFAVRGFRAKSFEYRIHV